MAEPLPLSELPSALAVLDGRRHHVAIVGGGGKTTVAFTVAGQLTGPTVVTSTTKMGADQHGGLPLLLSPADDELRSAAGRSVVVAWDRVEGSKAIGVGPERCDRWFGIVDHVVVEADGSRRQPFKAPGVFEPVVPDTTTLLVSVIGADALGKVIADRCHRPLRVAALARCRASERLTAERAAAVLLHERGARRELPAKARLAIVVNGVHDGNREPAGELVAALADREPELTVVRVRRSAEDPTATLR